MAIPAAEYIRMSTEDQKYSIPFQQFAIREYATRHGFSVCRTYADPGKSGVLIKHREGLSRLLQDVVAGRVNYKAILVYDVSRWGRFQNPDEAAHYEFICANAGVPVHYCGEQFSNDGSIQSALMKAIKRTMAGEFSRELGIKVREALERLVLEGFHAGAVAPYGLDRMLISASGHRKGILKRGEQKNIKSDRVILVAGKRHEVQRVREIFSMCADRHLTCRQIAEELNVKRLTYRGERWDGDRVVRVLHSPQYLGLNVWARSSQTMYGPSISRPREQWVTSKAPFEPIIDQSTFDRAQRILACHRRSFRSKEMLLDSLKRILARKGRLSAKLIARSPTPGVASTYLRRFGSLLSAYEQVGFKPAAKAYAMSEHTRRSFSLRKQALKEILRLFPSNVRLVRSANEHNERIEVDSRFRVSVLVCGKKSRPGRGGQFAWVLRLSPLDQQNPALICLLDSQWKNVVGHYLVRPLGDSITNYHCFYDTAWLTRSGIELKDLASFCDAVRSIALPTL
jgi:DNA invertase Pin-like site-specific DNA recombinase